MRRGKGRKGREKGGREREERERVGGRVGRGEGGRKVGWSLGVGRRVREGGRGEEPWGDRRGRGKGRKMTGRWGRMGRMEWRGRGRATGGGGIGEVGEIRSGGG